MSLRRSPSPDDGRAAMNLEMPARVPHMEVATWGNWPLLAAVTGIDVDGHSPEAVQIAAMAAFRWAWNHDFIMGIMITGDVFGKTRTNMGHAVWLPEKADLDTDVHTLIDDPDQALAFDPWETYGAIDQKKMTHAFEQDYKLQCARYPMGVNTTGIYPTLITGLTYILGWDMLLLIAGTDPQRFGDLADRYACWMQQYYNALAEADVPVVCCHDDMVWGTGAIFHPQWYRTYVFPNLKKLWAPLIESGKKVIFVCDGDYTGFVHDIVACGAHGFFIEPRTDLRYVAEHYGRTHVIMGNVDTRFLLSGPKSAIRAEVERCMAIGKGCPGYFIGVTNAIPYNTPIENALYYNEVYQELCQR